jgi:hypothetical protein
MRIEAELWVLSFCPLCPKLTLLSRFDEDGSEEEYSEDEDGSEVDEEDVEGDEVPAAEGNRTCILFTCLWKLISIPSTKAQIKAAKDWQ